MSKSYTITGYANVDPRDGSITVDVRNSGNAGGKFTVTDAPSNIGAFPAPAAPTLSVVTVASAPGGTRYVKIAYNRGTTGIGPLSAAAGPQTPSAGQGVQVAAPTAYDTSLGFDQQAATAAPRGVDGYTVFFATTLNGTYTQQNTTPIALGTAYTETSAGVLNNGAVPSGDTSGWTSGACTVTVTQP